MRKITSGAGTTADTTIHAPTLTISNTQGVPLNQREDLYESEQHLRVLDRRLDPRIEATRQAPV